MDFSKVLQNVIGAALVVLMTAFIGVGQVMAQTTYYVDVITGLDTYNGSQMAVGGAPNGPFKTISKAVTEAVDGDTIVILAGDYTAEASQTIAEDLTLQVRTSGGNLNVVFEGFTIATAGKTLTLGVETPASGGTFLSEPTPDGDELVLTAGTVNVTGGLTFSSGSTITRTNGTLTGIAPTVTNLNVTYTGALAGGITAGNELPSNIGTGTLTFAHTAATVTGTSTSAAVVTSTSAGGVSFSGNLAVTGAGPGALNVSGGATFGVTGAVNSSGGATISGASAVNLGITVMTGNDPFAHSGTGAVTVASLDLGSDPLSVLNVSSTGAFTVSGTTTWAGTAGRVAINNTGAAVVTLTGAVTTGAPFVDAAGNQAGIASTISNAAGEVIVNGVITEGTVVDAIGSAGETDYHVVNLVNGANGKLTLGASSTLRGNVNNAEADVNVSAGDGILLTNSSTLTLSPNLVANVTQLGDFVGGTLVLAYANAAADALTGGTALTTANNVTFSSAANVDNVAAGALTILGDLRLQDPGHVWGATGAAATTFTVGGTLFIEANGQTIWTNGAAQSFAGIDVGTTTGSSFGDAGTVTVTGTTAVLSNTTFGGNFIGTGTAVATATAGATFSGSFAGASLSVSGGGTVTIATAINTSGNVTIASGTTLALTAPGNGSDMGGAVDVNGTLAITGASTGFGIGSMDIDPTTGSVSTAGATVWNFDGSGFVGGTYTDTGTNDIFNFAIPATGATISPKPGTVWGGLGVTGSGRTATLTESVTIAGSVTVGNDAVLALGEKSLLMTGAGTLTLTDEAQITNTGTNGSVQFLATGQTITVTGAPATTPSLANIVVNYAGGAPLTIDEPINITGTLNLIDGGVVINGTGGVNNAAAPVGFTGGSSGISRTFPNEGITFAGAGGSVTGTYDLTLTGTLGTAANEYSATQMRNLTVSSTGIATFPATVATITGNFAVTNATGGALLAANLTVPGTVTATGDIDLATHTLSTAGAVTLANNATGGVVLGTGTLQLTGAGVTHTLGGEVVDAVTTRFSATGIVINGSIAAGDADGDSELGIILSDAGSSATLNSIQTIDGATVTVNGALVANLVLDAAGANDADDGQIDGAVSVNNGGALTVSSNLATTSFGSTVLVADGGTLTLGSNLGAVGDITVGNGSQTTPATVNLGTFTLTAGGGASALTLSASAAPATAPSFGTTGTVVIAAASNIVAGITATNTTIPNLTVNGGAATDIDTPVTVTGTFTVAGASIIGANDSVTLSGTAAIGQINANLTSGTIGATGGTLITTGTTIQTAVAAVTITNLRVASTSTTTMQRSNAGSANFTVVFLDHDSGVLDITDETLTLVGDDTAASIDWDYDGGTYAATGGGTIVIDDGVGGGGANNEPILLDTNNATVSVVNLTVNDNGGATTTTGGIHIGSADGLTVTGTLTLNTATGTASANVKTEWVAGDATFSMANGSTIVRSTSGAGDHFDNVPTLGTGMTVRYTNNGANTTTANELPAATARLEFEGTLFTLIFEDAVAASTGWFETAGPVSVDDNDDGDNTLTITAGGTVDYDADTANFVLGGGAVVETFTAAGAVTLLFNNVTVAAVRTAIIWPVAVTGSTVTVQINGAVDTVTLDQNRSAGAVTVGDGVGNALTPTTAATLATGAFTLTTTGMTVLVDGIVTGTVVSTGAITSAGSFPATASATGNVSLAALAANNPASLTLNGTTAQTLTAPAAGAQVTALVVNNAAGVSVTGGNLSIGSNAAPVAAGLTLTAGVLNMGTNTLLMPHGGSGQQGYTRTSGCVYGNVRKDLSNTAAGAPADRMEFPLCSFGGVYRPYAITFNNPNTIGGLAPVAGPPAITASPAMTIRHDVATENGAVDISGTNGLPVTVNGVSVARYPTLNSFFWTVSPSFTMSPSLNYDVDMRANDYPNFTSSCDQVACDINEIFPIRRHVGSNNNLWAVASSTLNNFLAGANDPVVVGTGATGTLQTSGTIFTYGLKSIFAAGAATTVNLSAGGTHSVTANSLFTGFQGNVTVTGVSGGGTTASGASAAPNVTFTGGTTVGATTITVTATDSFGASATATVTVNNAAALAVGTATADQTMNVTNTFTVTYANVFTGGSGTATYSCASSGASATVVDDGTTCVVTGAAAGGPDTITLTATDQSSTPVVVTSTFNVTVNTSVAAGALGNQTVVDNATVTQDVSATFSGGTVAGAYAVTATTSDAATATVVSPVVGNSVEVTGASPYVITGTTVADAPPVTITVTGTDDLGESATTTYTVDVTPVQGDVDGDGDADIFDAVAVLDFAVGIGAPAAGTKQFAAADWNSNGTIQSFDAFAIFNATTTPKAQKEIAENVVADLAWGEVTRNEVAVELPVTITGDINAAVAAQLWTKIDPEVAKVTGVTFLVEDAIASAYHVTEEGDLSLAVIGGYMPSDGIMATISLELFDSAAEFEIAARGAVNNNAAADIDALEVLELPEAFALLGNYPNPFNPSTNIQFDLPASSEVSIEVYDMLGRRVMVVPAQTIQAGAKRSLQINASALASGSYFYRVIAKAESSVMVDSGRMLLVK